MSVARLLACCSVGRRVFQFSLIFLLVCFFVFSLVTGSRTRTG